MDVGAHIFLKAHLILFGRGLRVSDDPLYSELGGCHDTAAARLGKPHAVFVRKLLLGTVEIGIKGHVRLRELNAELCGKVADRVDVSLPIVTRKLALCAKITRTAPVEVDDAESAFVTHFDRFFKTCAPTLAVCGEDAG